MKFAPNQIIREGADLGIILQSGDVTYDIVWMGGSTSRYRYVAGRDVRIATKSDLEHQELSIKHLHQEAHTVRKERREGARIKRGAVHPSR
jgi:hypothetical protein